MPVKSGLDSPAPAAMPAPLLSTAESEEIRRAVAAVEARTGTEVVARLVAGCDPYEQAYWKGVALGALAGLTAVSLWLRGWGAAPWHSLAAAVLGALVAGLAVALWPDLRRRLVPASVLDRRVEARAAEAFVAHEVFATRARSGILVLVARFEHRVVVLADSGVHGKVARERWNELAREIAAGMRSGRAADALRLAVVRCGELLDAAGFRAADGDANELPDAPVATAD